MQYIQYIYYAVCMHKYVYYTVYSQQYIYYTIHSQQCIYYTIHIYQCTYYTIHIQTEMYIIFWSFLMYRATMKMANIDAVFDFMFTEPRTVMFYS